LGLTPKVVGQTIKVPVKNRYRNPRQVGQDRLVCAYAAGEIYGRPAIVVDSGTAITFDILSKKNEYLGGIIAPGIRLSAETLFSKTALLPKIKIHAPSSIIGRDTESSILSGLFYGYGMMILGLIERISKKITGRPRVIATGGYTDILRKFVANRIDKVDKTLVFKGLGILWQGQK